MGRSSVDASVVLSCWFFGERVYIHLYGQCSAVQNTFFCVYKKAALPSVPHYPATPQPMMTPLRLLLLVSSCLGGSQYITYTPTGATVLPHASRYYPYAPSGAALAYTGYPQAHYTRYPQRHYYSAPITAARPLTAFR